MTSMDYRRHLTAAVKDYVLSTGVNIHDTNRYRATVAKGTRALTTLFEQASLHGLGDEVVSGYFKLSAREPKRLVKLVDSVVMLRLPDVGRALVAYDRNH